MEIKKENNWLVIDGKYYKVRESDNGEIKFRAISKNEVNAINDLVKEIGDRLENSVNPRMVLDDALAEMTIAELRCLHKNLFKEKKPAQVKKGCLQIKVGSSIVQLR